MSTVQIELPKGCIPLPGERRLWRHEARLIVLFNVGGKLYAVDDTCPRAGASLASGKLQGRMLQCPAHGLKFDLADGCMHLASSPGMALSCFAVQENEGGATITLAAADSTQSTP